MKSVVGYSLAIGGLLLLAIGLGTLNVEIPFFSSSFASVIGVILIVAGVVFLRFFTGKSKSSKHKQSKEEVPIYQGEGKDRVIVGYRRG